VTELPGHSRRESVRRGVKAKKRGRWAKGPGARIQLKIRRRGKRLMLSTGGGAPLCLGNVAPRSFPPTPPPISGLTRLPTANPPPTDGLSGKPNELLG